MGHWVTDYWAGWHWRPDHWRDFGVAAFRLYDAANGTLLRVLDGDEPYSADIANMFAAGSWTLGLSRVDVFGSESDRTLLTVQADSGGDVATQIVTPSVVRARPLAGGEIELRWISANTTDQLAPTEFEVAEQSSLGVALETIAANGQASFAAVVGPFPNSATIALAVRATDGASRATEWVFADAVVSDSSAPPTPDVLP